MIISLLTSVDLEIISASDRGTLAADVRDYLEKAFRLLGRPLSRRILPDLYAQMSRDSALASALRTVILEPKRKNVGQLLERAVRRGELSGDIDFDLAFDLIAGPIFWHALVSRTRAGEIFMDRLAESVTESLLTAGKPAPFLPSQTD